MSCKFLLKYQLWNVNLSSIKKITNHCESKQILSTGLFRAECNFLFWNYGHLYDDFIGFLGLKMCSGNRHLIFFYQFVSAILHLCVIVILAKIYEVNLPYKLTGQLNISRYDITLLAVQWIFSKIHKTTNIRIKAEYLGVEINSCGDL